MHTISFKAMGCEMQAMLDSNTLDARRALAEVPAWFEDWEQRLSRFRPSSELSQLNAAGGRPMAVSPAFWQVVDFALQAERETHGLVTPLLLDALEAAGYDRSFDALEKTGARATASAAPHPAPRAADSIRRDPRQRTLQLLGGARLDLGGVAKGWAADRAARRLGMHWPALVDAGGDIAAAGPRPDSLPWSISISSPLRPDEDLEALSLSNGGVATSGRDYRRWQRDGLWYHHILDPRTGRPAETDVLSVTVAGPSAVRAEMAAKAALILGSQPGLAYLDARPELAGLLVKEDGQVLRSTKLPFPIAA
ncbi:MAG: FAD:protein FMN transferase [Anaerolineales bacterium]